MEAWTDILKIVLAFIGIVGGGGTMAKWYFGGRQRQRLEEASSADQRQIAARKQYVSEQIAGFELMERATSRLEEEVDRLKKERDELIGENRAKDEQIEALSYDRAQLQSRLEMQSRELGALEASYVSYEGKKL